MSDITTTKRFVKHQNAFGFLRLLFASLVIVSHAPEIYDGDRHREILSRLFGTLSFGEIAVNAFFFISGYLITGSYLSSLTPQSYIYKRVARIYPGFIVATLFCLLVVAPEGGANLATSSKYCISALVRMLTLQVPDVGSVFHGTYYAGLNQSMWTISYEFKCYLLVLALGLIGALKHRRLVAGGAIVMLALSIKFPIPYVPPTISIALHSPSSTFSLHAIKSIAIGGIRNTVRLVAIFMTGSSFFLYRDKLSFGPIPVILGFLGLVGCMFSFRLANAGTAVFGGFSILAAAGYTSSGIVSRINNKNDISYGLYLYAFPIMKLIFWWWPNTSLLVSGVSTFVLACLCGWISWTFVEKPIMELLRKRQSSSRAVNDVPV